MNHFLLRPNFEFVIECDGWVQFKCKCYKTFPGPEHFIQALMNCHNSWKAILAEPKNKDENEAVRQAMGQQARVHIGIARNQELYASFVLLMLMNSCNL